MKILAFAATNSRNSINGKLIQYTASLISNADIEYIDINDYEMPIYSQDREEAHGIPQLAQQFYKKIGQSDALIISFAEHNGTYTAAYKNLFDWTSRINQKFYQDKPMLLMATSPGPGGAASVLNTASTSAPYFAGDVQASVSLPNFYDNFDMDKLEVINAEKADEIKQAVLQMLE